MLPTPGEPDPVAPSPEAASVEERLRRLEVVTDVALSRLDVDELLQELLERVRDLLSTDTAAVLLLDDSEQFLVATAARGLEEEVRQGSRIAVGRGFAGRVAAERRAVVIDEVSPATVVNPVLMMKGVQSMLGVPLLDGDVLLGVLHVGTLRSRSFTPDDIVLLEQVADRAALAIRVGRGRSDRVAAAALQRSLSPARLPSFDEFDVAARYVPGSQFGVGGDWYDVFGLPGGMLGVTIGDVMGHGLRAATIMERLRTVLRAYALEDDDPARVLERLDHNIQHFEPGQTATVIYAVLDPRNGTARVSSAGHLPPILARPGTPAEQTDPFADVLLGAQPGARRHETLLTVPPGARLCLFTDGLVERRGSDLDTGLARLREVLARPFASSEHACAEVMAMLIGDTGAEDDVALLILTRADS
ncbi:MAG TPA: GAF domain-containing SpoIIE family protein phosphatase [Nocardioidaceae bacterium]|nr:GAF domain-containing SpoIIE family protein phosphatase [Nocardioidaceae bacterium]